MLNKATHICKPLFGVGYVCALMAGALFWVTVNSVQESIGIQFLAGSFATTLSWVMNVLLVNEGFVYPSRQQMISLVFHLVTEASILLQVRLILS